MRLVVIVSYASFLAVTGCGEPCSTGSLSASDGTYALTATSTPDGTDCSGFEVPRTYSASAVTGLVLEGCDHGSYGFSATCRFDGTSTCASGEYTLDVLFGSAVRHATGTLARGSGTIDCQVEVDVERL